MQTQQQPNIIQSGYYTQHLLFDLFQNEIEQNEDIQKTLQQPLFSIPQNISESLYHYHPFFTPILKQKNLEIFQNFITNLINSNEVLPQKLILILPQEVTQQQIQQIQKYFLQSIQYVLVSNQAIKFSLLSSGKTEGIIVNIGHMSTQCALYISNMSYKNQIYTIYNAGHQIQQRYLNYLRKIGQFDKLNSEELQNLSYLTQITDQIVQITGKVASRVEKSLASRLNEKIEVEIKNLKFQLESLQITRIYENLIESEDEGNDITGLIQDCISKWPSDMLKPQILVTGGVARVKGLCERIQENFKEYKVLIDENYENSVWLGAAACSGLIGFDSYFQKNQ